MEHAPVVAGGDAASAGIDPHGAEFEHREDDSVFAGASREEEYRTWVGHQYADRNQNHDRRKYYERRRSKQSFDRSPHATAVARTPHLATTAPTASITSSTSSSVMDG